MVDIEKISLLKTVLELISTEIIKNTVPNYKLESLWCLSNIVGEPTIGTTKTITLILEHGSLFEQVLDCLVTSHLFSEVQEASFIVWNMVSLCDFQESQKMV